MSSIIFDIMASAPHGASACEHSNAFSVGFVNGSLVKIPNSVWIIEHVWMFLFEFLQVMNQGVDMVHFLTQTLFVAVFFSLPHCHFAGAGSKRSDCIVTWNVVFVSSAPKISYLALVVFYVVHV